MSDGNDIAAIWSLSKFCTWKLSHNVHFKLISSRCFICKINGTFSSDQHCRYLSHTGGHIFYIVDIILVDGLVLSVLWLSACTALAKLILNDFPCLNGKIKIHDSNITCA